MNALATFIGWIAAGWRRVTGGQGERPIIAESPWHTLTADELAVEAGVDDANDDSGDGDSDEAAQSAEAIAPAAGLDQRDVAFGLDHYDGQTRDGQAPQADQTDSFRVLRFAVDGSTCWSIGPPGPEGWQIYRVLAAAFDLGDRHVELEDQNGEIVTLALERGSVSGEWVIRTSWVRIGIRRRRAEVSITANAAEVEGVEAWFEREIPRAVFWLLGRDMGEAGTEFGMYGLTARAHDLGVKTKRIEVCADVVGMPITNELQHELVTRATIHPHQGRAGVHSVGISNRQSPHSMEIYSKPEELNRRRGPTRAALIADYGEHGGEQITRAELRVWGKALLLEGVDATHPGAPLDAGILAQLWADGLTRHWRAEPAAARAWRSKHEAWAGAPEASRGPEPRLRDCPEDPAWAQLRAAGGLEGRVKFTRAKVVAQHGAVREHHRVRLLAEAAHVDVLEGEGDGREAIRQLEAGIDDARRWAPARRAAEARHREMLKKIGEGQ